MLCSCGKFMQQHQLLDVDDNVMQVTLKCKPCARMAQGATYEKALDKWNIKYGDAAEQGANLQENKK